jgi:beta-glucosidase
LRKAMGDAVEYQPGVKPRGSDGSGIPAAIEAAKRADIVLLAIGEDYDFTGEARCYAEIGLPGLQVALVEALKATGKPTVAILMGGRPLALEKVLTGIPAVLQTWLLGVESGPAIAEILAGRASPGGRLPIGMPRVTGQSPIPYAHAPTGRPANPDLSVDSARYRDVDIGPLFPFGHGLGYSEVAYGPLTLSVAEMRGNGTLVASVSVTNRGTMAVDEVVQLYANDPIASVARPDRELRGFARVPLKPGETRKVSFTLAAAQFAIWQAKGWAVEPGEIKLMAGASSADIRSEASFSITAAAASEVPATAILTRVEVA